MTVRIARAAYDAMIEHFQQAAPNEGCGLLAGPNLPCPRDTGGDGNCGRPLCPVCGLYPDRHADTWLPMRNVAEHPRVRFEMEPAELLHGWEILAKEDRRPWVVVHSHVTTDAVPSPHDIRYATDSTLLHMVVSLNAPTPYARLWEVHPYEVDPAQRLARRTMHLVDLREQETSATDLTRRVSDV